MQQGQGRGQGIILDRMTVTAALKGWCSSRGLSRQHGDGGRGPGTAAWLPLLRHKPWLSGPEAVRDLLAD